MPPIEAEGAKTTTTIDRNVTPIAGEGSVQPADASTVKARRADVSPTSDIDPAEVGRKTKKYQGSGATPPGATRANAPGALAGQASLPPGQLAPLMQALGPRGLGLAPQQVGALVGIVAASGSLPPSTIVGLAQGLAAESDSRAAGSLIAAVAASGAVSPQELLTAMKAAQIDPQTVAMLKGIMGSPEIAALATPQGQLAAKRQFLTGLLHLDAQGKLEPGVAALVDMMINAGKVPAAMADQKPALVHMAAAAIRAEAWVVHHPNYQGWEALGEKVWNEVRSTQATPESGKTLFESEGFLREFEDVTGGARFVGGNDVRRLDAGSGFYDGVKQLLETSDGPLYLNNWGIYDDVTGQEVADLIARRVAEGVKIYVMVDEQVSHKHGSTILPQIEGAGVEVVRWKDGDRPVGNHVKFVTDGRVAITGGSNLGDVYTHAGPADTPKRSDSNIRIEGPGARRFVSLFNVLRNYTGLVPLDDGPRGRSRRPGTEKVSVIHTAAADDSNVLAAILKTIAGAQDHLFIKEAYFILTPPMETAIRDFLQRGGRLDLVTNSATSVDEPTIAGAMAASARRVLEIAAEEGASANVKVHLKQGDTLHDKVIVADRVFSLDKTYNVHPRSEWLEHEIAVATQGAETAGEHLTAFADEQAAGSYLTLTSPDQIPPVALSPEQLMLALFKNNV